MIKETQTADDKKRNMDNFKAHIEALKEGRQPPAIKPPEAK